MNGSRRRPTATPKRARLSLESVTVERRAARALLIADDAVLLIRACDPSQPERGEWWLTPGGGVEDGESLEDAVQFARKFRRHQRIGRRRIDAERRA